MRLTNSTTRYGAIARLLHWTSVGLLLMSVMLGIELQAGPPMEERAALIARHSSYGLALLALMLMRYAWRLRNLNPLLSYRLPAWHKRGAITMHWFVYAAVITQCLVGLAQLLADGSAIAVFEIVLRSASASGNPGLRARLNDVHAALAPLIYAAVALHVCGALYHQAFGVVDEPRA